MRKLSAFICVALFALIAAEATAQEKAGDADVTVYEFYDELVEGSLIRPEEVRIQRRNAGNARSLIRIRDHFIPDMLKSLENI